MSEPASDGEVARMGRPVGVTTPGRSVRGGAPPRGAGRREWRGGDDARRRTAGAFVSGFTVSLRFRRNV